MCELEPGMIDPEAPKLLCVSVEHSVMGKGYTVPLSELLLGEMDSMLAIEFEEARVGDAITLTACYMSREELDALPEFEGW